MFIACHFTRSFIANSAPMIVTLDLTVPSREGKLKESLHPLLERVREKGKSPNNF